MSDANKPGIAIAQKQYQETMPKLALELNSRVLVNLNPMTSDKPARLQGEFLGASHYEFLILHLPAIPGLITKLIPGMRLEVSFQVKGAINKFFSEVISYVAKPCLMLFTTYPDRMAVMEVRKDQRVTCALPITLSGAHGDGVAVIGDLSKGGCRLRMELTGQSHMRQLTEGDRVMFRACFAGCSTAEENMNVVRGTGTVRAVEISGSRMNIGLAFDEGDKAFTGALTAYLNLVQVLE
jgi:hypothetical protein